MVSDQQMISLVNRLQVLDLNQTLLTTSQGIEVWQLCVVGKGTREFVKLMFKYPDGSLTFYVNELKQGKPEVIDNDEEFEEITIFMDLAMHRAKHGTC